jgi:hypothetical protein
MRVGIAEDDGCYIGTLDTVNKVPSADHIKAVYVDLANGHFVVALESELIYMDKLSS